MGYYPKKGEVENSKIKSLASRLKADSLGETLTNVLEWQERNIQYWTESHPFGTMLLYMIVGFFVGFLVLRLTHLLNLISCAVLLGLAGGIVMISFSMIWAIHSNRKIPVMEGFGNAICPRSIPIDAVLKYRLGVCTDYAKLTACLLLNIYPDESVYFATAPGHVATGKMIGERLYMLDQRLPILTIDRWRKYRHPRWYNKVKRFQKNGRPEKIDIKPRLSTSIDTEKGLTSLAMKMTKLLNIKEQTSDEAISPLEIPWKKASYSMKTMKWLIILLQDGSK
jgi:predicted transglutaminase-like protease